jgi:hypothetical protein
VLPKKARPKEGDQNQQVKAPGLNLHVPDQKAQAEKKALLKAREVGNLPGEGGLLNADNNSVITNLIFQ